MPQDNIEELMRLHGKDILHFIRFYTRNHSEAEDLFQEVFIRAYNSSKRLNSQREYKAWLLRIAINICHNASRWYKRHPYILTHSMPDKNVAPSAESEAVLNEDHQQLMRSVLRLPSKYKDVILLHYFEEQSVVETARTLGISESTVKVRLLRARKRLKHMDGGIYDGGAEGTTAYC